MIRLGKNWLKKQTLVFKLSVGILESAFLGIIILLSVITNRSETIIKEQILELTDNTIQASVDNISHLVLETEQAVRNLRNTLNQLNKSDTPTIQIALSSTIKAIYNSGLNLSHAAIYSFPKEYSTSGTVYTAFAKDNGFSFRRKTINDFYEKFPWLKEVKEGDEIFWSEPYINPNSPTKQMVITCVLPFKFHGQQKYNGLVSISIDLQDIQKYIDNSSFHGHGKLLLLSRSGLYINHPNPEINQKTTIFQLAKKLKIPQLYVIGQKVLSGQSGYMQMPYSSVYRKPTVFFYAPIPHLNWGLCLIYSQAQLFKPVHNLQIMISAIIGMFILLIIINRICHYSTKPLQKLARIATQYGTGNFADDISEAGSFDEIGTLSSAFHNMRTNLIKYIDKERQVATERQKDLSELEIAKTIQRSALPVDFPEHRAFQLYALMDSAQKVGGDFYDFFFLGKNKFAIVIADVAGKGISAALYMMRAQEIIKHTVQYTNSIAKVFERVNNVLCEGNKTCMFVSAFLGIINLETGEMEYINAGHLPPFLIEDDKCRKITPLQNFVLGAREGITFHSEKIMLPANSRIFLYTDGVTEAQNSKGKFYGEERLSNILRKYPALPKETIKNVMTDIGNFAKGSPQSDDITMLTFLYRGNESDVLTIEADIKKIKTVLDFIDNNMSNKKIVAEIRSRMIAIAEEIFANIAMYAYKTSGNVRIEAALNNGCYYLTFIDKGRPYNPLEQEAPDITLLLEQRKFGGLGIFIVKSMADSMVYSYKNGENILKIEISTKETSNSKPAVS